MPSLTFFVYLILSSIIITQLSACCFTLYSTFTCNKHSLAKKSHKMATWVTSLSLHDTKWTTHQLCLPQCNKLPAPRNRPNTAALLTVVCPIYLILYNPGTLYLNASYVPYRAPIVSKYTLELHRYTPTCYKLHQRTNWSPQSTTNSCPRGNPICTLLIYQCHFLTFFVFLCNFLGIETAPFGWNCQIHADVV